MLNVYLIYIFVLKNVYTISIKLEPLFSGIRDVQFIEVSMYFPLRRDGMKERKSCFINKKVLLVST